MSLVDRIFDGLDRFETFFEAAWRFEPGAAASRTTGFQPVADLGWASAAPAALGRVTATAAPSHDFGAPTVATAHGRFADLADVARGPGVSFDLYDGLHDWAEPLVSVSPSWTPAFSAVETVIDADAPVISVNPATLDRSAALAATQWAPVALYGSPPHVAQMAWIGDDITT